MIILQGVVEMNLNTTDSDALAEKLRRENFEQFNTLVRMHLSFILDLNTDDNEVLIEKGKLRKWSFAPFHKKSKSNPGIMDGVPLTQEGICQVYQLIEFLRKEQHICTEGIFRRSGSLIRQQELKNLLSQGITVSLDGATYSVHDCASVLKGFLSDLPEPLLTDAHYPAYCQIAELCGVYKKSTQEQRLLHALQLLLLLLPSENRILFKDVLDLLHLTSSQESSNKMSADNLATIFTPHFLCPRNLSPEGLHSNSQNLIGVVSFMIRKFEELFHVPPKLAVDIKAYYTERERRKMLSPKKNFNESVSSDNFAASTVYSFVDVERTAKENQSNPTETALAQLYAYIQSLPESSKKRKLVKQFNKENGHGTPLQLLHTNTPKNKSLSNCIKKHIFQKKLVKSGKKNGFTEARASSEELLSTPLQSLTPRTKLFCTKCDSSTDVSNDENFPKKLKQSYVSMENIENETYQNTISEIKRSASDPNISTNTVQPFHNSYLTSTPACIARCAHTDMIFTPKNQGRKSMSPITRSTQRMSKAMQETMMTPRSRKPVLLVSGTNINNLPKLEVQNYNVDSIDELPVEANTLRKSRSLEVFSTQDDSDDGEPGKSLTNTFREYLQSRNMVTITPTDLSFSSCTDDYCSEEIGSQLSSSLLHCLNGDAPEQLPELRNLSKCSESENSKIGILRPKEFDCNGKPIIYETSF